MRRGSGINKGTDPEQSAKRVQEGRQGRRMSPGDLMRGGFRGFKGVQGCLGGVQGVPGGAQGGPEVLGRKRAKNKKPEKRSGAVWLAATPGFCAGGSSKTNGSGYPLSVPAVAHPNVPAKEPPKCPTRHPRVGGYLFVCIHIYVSTYINNTPVQLR